MVLKFCSIAVVIFSMLLMRSNGYTYHIPQAWGATECLDDDGTSHPVDEVWYDNKNCEELKCVTYKEEVYARAYGCIKKEVPENCTLTAIDKSVNYPNCCPVVKCKKCECECRDVILY